MKKCINCGAELIDEAAFCSHCGTACEEDMATQLLAEEDETTLLEESVLQEPNAPSPEIEDEATSLLDEEMMGDFSSEEEEGTTVLDEQNGTVSPNGKFVHVVGKEEIQKNIEKKSTYRNNLTSVQYEKSKTETAAASKEQNDKKKKTIIIVIVAVFLLTVLIIAAIYGAPVANDALSYEADGDESLSTGNTEEIGDDTKGDYNGLHWEIGYYADENGKDVKYVFINGSGKLDNDFFFNVNIMEPDQIDIDGDIDICFDTGSSNFNNVTTITIGEGVNHIGYGSLSQFFNLEKVFVFDRNCEIDFEEGDGVYETLGPSMQEVEIICYRGSTAEKYVNTWNEGTDSNYQLSFFDE